MTGRKEEEEERNVRLMQRRLKQPLFASIKDPISGKERENADSIFLFTEGDDYIPLNFDDDDRKGGRSQGDGQQAISLGKRKRDATSDESDEDETEYLYPWFESFSKIRLQQPFSITELQVLVTFIRGGKRDLIDNFSI